MYFNLHHLFQHTTANNILRISWKRLLTHGQAQRNSLSSKLQAALRPFIFSVHPDLFAQLPLQKRTNEASLKALNEYIQQSQHSPSISDDLILKFYQRVDTVADQHGNSSSQLKLIRVHLTGDVLNSVRELLRSNELPLEVIDDIINKTKTVETRPDRPIDWIHTHYYAATGKKYPFTDVWEELRKLKPAVTLHRWISSNIDNARQLELDSKPLRDDYHKLHKHVISKYGLADIRWNCGWRGTHQLTSLRSLNKLLEGDVTHQHILKDRVVIFGNEGGVSVNGEVILCSEEVPQQWSKALSNVSSANRYLEMIPNAEKQLSSLLCDIQIIQRSVPPLPLAEAYYHCIAGLISRFGMAYDMSTFKVESLNHLVLVVSGSIADELTLTPEGHINVPSHSPVWAIRNFIKDNGNTAVELRQQYQSNKIEAHRLMDLVKEEYELQKLSVNDNISYSQVIKCCENLLISSSTIRHSLKGIRLCIAPFFSVMNDGEMYILWNWVND